MTCHAGQYNWNSTYIIHACTYYSAKLTQFIIYFIFNIIFGVTFLNSIIIMKFADEIGLSQWHIWKAEWIKCSSWRRRAAASSAADQTSFTEAEMWVRRLDQWNIDWFENLSEFELILIQLDSSHTVHPESIHSASLFPHFVTLQPYSKMD